MALLSTKFKLKPQLTGADIKSLYEVEPNAFTDTDKTKLIGIATGAEVNVNADWDAVSGDAQILNKPTLGTAAATASTDYATAAQGTLADTALQPAALNNTALTGIPTAPTAAEGTNTTQIATTAFVLANAGIGSGIDNGIVINGVANFWQSTPPTQRVDGNALIDGDIWYQTGSKTWFRKGIYWVGSEKQLFAPFTITSPTVGSTIKSSNNFPIPQLYYSEKIVLLMDANRAFGNNSNDIYAVFNFDLINPGSGVNSNILSLSSQGIMQFGSKSVVHDTFVANSTYVQTRLIITSVVGALNNSSLQFGFEYFYREVYQQ